MEAMARACGLIAVSERNANGLPFIHSSAGEELVHSQPDVSIVLGDSPPHQPGTLYITTKRLIWLCDVDQKGYAVDFLSLAVHAISRDPEAYQVPCIYTQIGSDGTDDMEGEETEDALESENCGNGGLTGVHEMRLVPSDSSVLDHLFKVLCDCALLNPDPEGEQEAEGDWFFNEDEVRSGSIGQSNGVMGHDITVISELQINDERFEDADEMEEENDYL
eukprot:c24453_g1_i1 orf=537-1196(-)